MTPAAQETSDLNTTPVCGLGVYREVEVKAPSHSLAHSFTRRSISK